LAERKNYFKKKAVISSTVISLTR